MKKKLFKIVFEIEATSIEAVYLLFEKQIQMKSVQSFYIRGSSSIWDCLTQLEKDWILENKADAQDANEMSSDTIDYLFHRYRENGYAQSRIKEMQERIIMRKEQEEDEEL